MNRSKLMRRLSVVAALAVVLAVAAGTPALQAQPEAGSISAGTPATPGPLVQVWNGHNCPANVPVNISGLSAGLGGYETKIGWDAGRFNNMPANVGVSVTPYLTNGGTRTNSASGGTPLLKAVAGDTVKFGDYSWGAGNPVGNMADGQLATVALLPTATCGNVALTMSETQLVDINGSVIALTAQTGHPVSVFSQWDTDGSGGNVDAGDVIAVINNLGANAGTAGSCTSQFYRYDVDLSGGNIDAGDVIEVINRIGTSCQ